MIGEICFGLGLVVLAALGIVKARPSQPQLPPAKDPVFENFFVSLSIDPTHWKFIENSEIPWYKHKNTDLRFTLQPASWKDTSVSLPPSIHKFSSREVLHGFTHEEINRIRQLMKETEINKLFDQGDL